MISRDRFDAVENHIRDQNMFSQLAIGFGTFGLSLGIERGLQFWEEHDELSLAILVACAFSVVFAGIFWLIASDRKSKSVLAKKAMFDMARVVSDEQTLVTADGTEIRQQFISAGSSIPTLPGPPNAE